jgi:transcriptional regulator with XRE-family HTH domain
VGALGPSRRATCSRMICLGEMAFAHSESAGVVRSALGAVLRQRREATRRTLTEVANEAGLSPAHLSEVERGRKEVSTERLLAVAHALGARPADIYADLARLLGADADRPAWPEDPPATRCAAWPTSAPTWRWSTHRHDQNHASASIQGDKQ